MHVPSTDFQIVNRAALLIGFLAFTTDVPAQSPSATQSSLLAWDYPDELLVGSQVVRFELRVDQGVRSEVGLSAIASEPESYFAQVPATTVGQHLLEVRACGAGGCGAWSAPLLFHFDDMLVSSADTELDEPVFISDGQSYCDSCPIPSP